jgi:hypothetical protein
LIDLFASLKENMLSESNAVKLLRQTSGAAVVVKFVAEHFSRLKGQLVHEKAGLILKVIQDMSLAIEDEDELLRFCHRVIRGSSEDGVRSLFGAVVFEPVSTSAMKDFVLEVSMFLMTVRGHHFVVG